MLNTFHNIHLLHAAKSTASIQLFIFLSILFCTSAAANEQQELDMEYGEEINEICAGCHGVFGQGSIEGEYPRLAGLDAEYIAKQLSDFKQRKRLNIPMIPFANERELPDNDVRIISEYLSKIQLPTRLPPVDTENFDALERLEASKRVVNIKNFPGDIELGREFYMDECASCHAKDGFGTTKKKAPQLAGQYSEYLLLQIKLFRAGKRLHDEEIDDAEIFREFNDEVISNMLAFLATLDDD